MDPAAQRRGIGGLLLDDFIASALARGSHRLHLEVRDGNPAIDLYRASGFSAAGAATIIGDPGRSHDAVTLMLIE